MSDSHTIPEIRVGVPLVQDFARIAQDMRPDEIAQSLAFTGRGAYSADLVARALLASDGPQFVLVDRAGMPVAVGGFEPVGPGVFETWGIGTLAGWGKHWRAITKQSRRQMDRLFAAGAHRIQIISLASRTQAHGWYVNGLGMTFEGVLRGYCADGSDAVIHARTMRKAP